jgi:hypothetical protein
MRLTMVMACRRKQQAEAARAHADAARAALRQQFVGGGGAPGGGERDRQVRREEAAAAHKENKEREREADLIRRNYLGTPHQKRRITKASDKFKYAHSSLSSLFDELLTLRCAGGPFPCVSPCTKQFDLVQEDSADLPLLCTVHASDSAQHAAGLTLTGMPRKTRTRSGCMRAPCYLAAACVLVLTSARSANRQRSTSSRTSHRCARRGGR